MHHHHDRLPNWHTNTNTPTHTHTLTHTHTHTYTLHTHTQHTAAKLEWNRLFRELYDDTDLLSLSNYHQWIGWGDTHCAIPFNRYYSFDLGNVTLNEWVANLLGEGKAGEVFPRLADCQGANDDDAPCLYGVN